MAKRKDNIENKKNKKFKTDNALLSSGVFSAGSGDWDNEEQSFELQPRTVLGVGEVEALPIKRGGKVERVTRQVVEESDSDEGDAEANADADGSEEGAEGANGSDGADAPETLPEDKLTPQERLLRTKEEVAVLASRIMEDPEENISCLVSLRKLTTSNDLAASRLAILALIPVFKSLAPGYRIRPLTDAELREKVGKDLARQRRFEQALVTNWRDYVELLATQARVSALNSLNNKRITPQQIKLGQIAAKAACELCNSSLRHFNYNEELFTIPIRRLNRKPTVASDLEVFTMSLRTLETLLHDDKEHGELTFTITRILCKVIRDKKFRVDEAVINVFLSLALLDDYDPNSVKTDAPKMKKKDRVHLSKKQRKQRKELKAIETEMRKAEQAITAEQREKFQSQTLKQVLTLYLEILKAASDGDDVSLKLLVAAVMEGLAKFGEMANFDLLGDFLEVLKETMTTIVDEHTLQTELYGITHDDESIGGLYTPEEVRKLLLCISAAFLLVLNHGEAGRLPISFDLTKFIHTLHLILVDVSVSADLEFSHKTLRLADPLADSDIPVKPAVNVSTNAELLIKCLDLVFFRSRNGSLARCMPFVKRLYIALLQMPEKTLIATLKFVAKLIGKYGGPLNSMWSSDDRIASEGSYILGIEREGHEVEMERNNIGSAVLWENVLLDKHYCNIIKDGARSIMKNTKESNKMK